MGFNIFEKDTKMKYEIIQLLDQAKGAVSLEEIKKGLSERLSYSTIRDHCHTIKKLIDSIYLKHEVHLFLTTHTVHLEKNSSNLQFLIEALLRTDVNAQILNALIRNRKFKTDDFCFYHGISMSTLRRKNQLLNDFLKTFNLHITTSDRLTNLNGTDFNIYIFSFLSFFFIYRDTSRITHLKHQEHLNQLVTKIEHYLGVSWELAQISNVRLLIYIINNGTQFHQSGDTEFFSIPYLDFPEKPAFLNQWNTNDWNSFLLIMNCFELFDYSLALNVVQMPDKLTKNINIWKNEFENYFIPITDTQMEELRFHLVQQHLIRKFFPHNATTLNFYYSLNSIKHFEEDNPIYTIRFTNFWKSVCNKIAIPLLNEPFYLSINLLLCLYFCPLESLRECLSIFIVSNLGNLSLNYLKNELTEIFTPKIIPLFTNKIENADLILSLLPTIDIIVPSDQEELVISYPLEENDRMNLLYVMRKCLLKKITVPIENIDLASTKAALILDL